MANPFDQFDAKPDAATTVQPDPAVLGGGGRPVRVPAADPNADPPAVLGGGKTVRLPPADPDAPVPKVLGGPGATVVKFPGKDDASSPKPDVTTAETPESPPPEAPDGTATRDFDLTTIPADKRDGFLTELRAQPGIEVKVDPATNKATITAKGPAAPAPGSPPPAGTARLRKGLSLEQAQNDPYLRARPLLQQEVIRQINQQAIAEQALEAQTQHQDRIERLNAEAAYSTYLAKMNEGRNDPNFDYTALSAQINKDMGEGGVFYHHGNLGEALIDRIGQHTGESGRADYGRDYDKTLDSMLDGSITEYEQVMRVSRAGGLTQKGEDRLINKLNLLRKAPDERAIERVMTANERRVHDLFTHPPELMGVEDPAGAGRAERFIADYEDQFNSWRRKNPGKDPFEFLRDQDLLNRIAEQAYPSAQRTFNQGNAAAAKRQPGQREEVPVAPSGANADGWRGLVTTPPAVEGKGPWPMKIWGQVLQTLRDDPSDKARRDFNQMFGVALANEHVVSDANAAADEVLSRLNAPAASRRTVAPASPPISTTPEGETEEQFRERAAREHTEQQAEDTARAMREDAALRAAHEAAFPPGQPPAGGGGVAGLLQRREENLLSHYRQLQERRDLSPEERLHYRKQADEIEQRMRAR